MMIVVVRLGEQWLQESEIKHGRTAMLAFLGVVVPSLGITIPSKPSRISPCKLHQFYILMYDARSMMQGLCRIVG
jgi:hypothetical protein